MDTIETSTKVCLYCSSENEETQHQLVDFFVGKHNKITEYCKLQFAYCSSCKCFRSKASFESAKKTCLFCTSRKRKQHPIEIKEDASFDNSHIPNQISSLLQEIKIKYNPIILTQLTKVKFYEDADPQHEVRTISSAFQLCYQMRLHEKGQILISKFTFKGNLENDCGLTMALEFLVKCPQCTLKFKLHKLQNEPHSYLTKIDATQATLIYSLVRHGRVRKEQIRLKKGDIQGRDFEPLAVLCPGWNPPEKLDKNCLKYKKKISTALPHGCLSFSEFFLESSSFLAWKGSLKLLLEWSNQLTDSMVPKFLPSLQVKLTDLDSYSPKPKLYYWIKNDREGAPYELYYGSKRKRSPETLLQGFETFSPCLMRLIQHACEIISSYVMILAQK